MNWWGLFIILLGLLLMAGAVLNWGWIMNARRARFLSRFITEAGTRIFYIALGIGLVVWGILLLTGIV
jgi:uncharacterized membrane protein YidH (DUF202 family)